MSFEPVKRTDVGLMPVATLVLWVACVIVGLLGYLWPHEKPKPPATQPESTDAELVNVSLTDPKVAPPDQLVTPQNVDVAAAMKVPDLPAVMPPSPTIAFALPVVARAHVSPRLSGMPTQVFISQGDGDQPKPEYPVESQLAGQEGTVRVDFRVTPQGRITSVRITQPSEWPLLNQSALRCVRELWSFGPRMAGPHFVLIDFRHH